MLLKVIVNVAVPFELGDGLAPCRRVWVAILDVGRGSFLSIEIPDVDDAAGPLSGKDPATILVESVSIALGPSVLNITTSIGALTGCIDVAVGCGERTGEIPRVGNRTAV